MNNLQSSPVFGKNVSDFKSQLPNPAIWPSILFFVANGVPTCEKNVYIRAVFCQSGNVNCIYVIFFLITMQLNLRILGLSLFFGLCPFFPAFGEEFKAVGFRFQTITETDVRVFGVADSTYRGNVTIPATFFYNGIEHTVKNIGDNAFKDCTEITGISIPSTVTMIGNASFYGCTALANVVIPSTVNSIQPDAFAYCNSLERIVLPKGLTFLGAHAFGKSKALKTVVCMGKTKPTQSQASFDSDIYATATLYVPVGSLSNYQGAPTQPYYTNEFPKFSNIVELGNIVDGVAYTQDFDITANVRYSRNFNNTNWQALYVPFSLPIDTLVAHGLKIAALNDNHQYDNDNDGVADETRMEFFTVPSGETRPNYPYLIRAEQVGPVTLDLKDVEIKAAAEASIECSSINQRFTFIGSYDGVSGAEMCGNNYYAMAGGGLKRAADATVALKPQRWYMKVENKDGSSVDHYLAPTIRFCIDGEEEAAGALAIDTLHSSDSLANGVCYDMSGRRLSVRSGLYIQQGKIVLIRK